MSLLVGAAPRQATWERCPVPDCAGARAAGGACLAHLDEQALGQVLTLLASDLELDARGVDVSAALLERIVHASATPDDGRRRIGRVRFEGARFRSGVDLSGLCFTYPVSFEGARFAGDATFDAAAFASDAHFMDVSVAGIASFRGVSFGRQAWFMRASFSGPVSFERASFADLAWFDRATFGSDAVFDDARFAAHANFDGTTFARGAHLTRTAFTYAADRPHVAPGEPRRPGPAWPAGGQGIGPSPAPPARRGGVRVPVLVAALAVATLAAAGIGGAVVVSGRPSYPDHWDPRAADLVAFVERERGLTFKHPVPISFLDDATFRQEVTHTDAADEQDPEATSRQQAMLRAVGLLSGDIDLKAAGDELTGDAVVGLYSPEKERILVRGDTLDDEGRMTLVHELTHALQDQIFHIGAYQKKQKSSGADAAFRAVAEADAVKVADKWREALPAAAQASLEAAEKKTSGTADFKGVPPVFIELLGFPYAFGPEFLQAVVDKDGALGRNRLFTDPPTTEENIILPETYLSRQRATPVATPSVGGGDHAFRGSEDDVGMLSLLVMLSERLDFGIAWKAVQGWAGDSIVVFDRAGATCVRSAVAFDQAEQATRFASAFGQWARARPASATSDGQMVRFESCDPGAAAANERAKGHVSGIRGLAMRRALIADLSQGIPPKAAACTVDGLLEKMGADRLDELESTLAADPKNPAKLEIQRAAAQVVAGCR